MEKEGEKLSLVRWPEHEKDVFQALQQSTF